MLPVLAHARHSRGAPAAHHLLSKALTSSQTLEHVQVPWACVQQHQQHLYGKLLHQCQQQQQQQCLQVRCMPFRQLWQPAQDSAHRFMTTSAGTRKSLRDIMKVDLMQHKTADEVEHIWMQHHADSPSHIASAMSKDEHTILTARAAASPLFVLPLAKKPGTFQTLLLQWQPPSLLLFTTLDEFKQWGTQAPPHLTVQLYDDLADSHGLVLLRGDLINTGLINAAEGRTLLELARAFYRDAAAYRMVYAFNHTPQKFDFQQLCRELGVNTGAPGPAGPGQSGVS